MRQSLRGVGVSLALIQLIAGCSNSTGAGDVPLQAAATHAAPATGGSPAPSVSAGSSAAASGGTGAISNQPAAGTIAMAVGGQGAISGGAGKAGPSAGTGAAAGTSGGVLATAGVSAAAGGTGGGSETGKPMCKGKTSQVAIVGDSYINWASHTLPADLAKEAGETWRMYAVGGASMTAGGIAKLIPAQFEDAITADKDILTLVMDGGGNDVLICDQATYSGCDKCKQAGAKQLPVCLKIVQDTLATFTKLQDRAAMIGVKDIVYFFYPDVPANTPIGGPNPNEIADFAMPMWKATCEGTAQRTGGKLRCHFVDMVPVFKGHDDYFASGDIHPNPMGSAAMAKAIVGKMKEDCVWQDASGGCCAP
jgi:hypothetical protein